MTSSEIKRIFHIEDIMNLPHAVNQVLFSAERDDMYRELIRIHQGDMSYDWFQSLYEQELSQRNQKKQDFTPSTLGLICSQIVGEHNSVHEPTAGNGSMIIQDWWRKMSSLFPWEAQFIPYYVDCWELSDRSMPLLLLNLSIRGINARVHHGDVLTQEEKEVYLLKSEDPLSFSNIIKIK